MIMANEKENKKYLNKYMFNIRMKSNKNIFDVPPKYYLTCLSNVLIFQSPMLAITWKGERITENIEITVKT